MTQQTILEVERREQLGKAVKRLRRKGLIPGNLYGKGKESQPVQLDGHQFSKFIAVHGPSTLIELRLDGSKKGETVMVAQIQRESVSHDIQHVDFLYVQMSKPMRLRVPIHIEGEAPAVKRDNGVLLHVLEYVEVEALPASLPEALTLDISDMEEVKSTRHVSDLRVPSDVILLTPPDEVVVKIEAPHKLEVPAEAAEAQAAGAGVSGAGSSVEE